LLILKPLFSLPTFKQQTIALGLGLLLLCAVIFQLNIRKTIGVYSHYRDQLQKVGLAASAPARIATLQKKLANAQQSALKPYKREMLLENVTDFCRNNNLLIRAFPEAQKVVQNENNIVTNQIEIEGNFKSMVKLVYMLEAAERLGSVGSLKFFVFKDRTAKRNVLKGQIVLRNLES
jgi:hypothetical protein